MSVAKQLGATHVVNFKDGDVVEQIMALTDGRGVDVSIEALGTQGTFESALRILRPGGRLSSLGVYSTDLRIPLGAFAAGLGDYSIITTLCPGGKERMRRLLRRADCNLSPQPANLPGKGGASPASFHSLNLNLILSPRTASSIDRPALVALCQVGGRLPRRSGSLDP
jgi:hypothetical protein